MKYSTPFPLSAHRWNGQQIGRMLIHFNIRTSTLLKLLVCLILYSAAGCWRAKAPDEHHQDVTRFIVLHVQTRSTALGTYERIHEGRYKLKYIIRQSLDMTMPETLSTDEVKKGWISSLVNHTPSIVVAQSGRLSAMPIVDGKIVYFVSQAPQPKFLLTVPLDRIIERLEDKHQPEDK